MQGSGETSLGGQWFLAALMLVIVSWFIFRNLMPRSSKEWRGYGILQAFVVALYAEMYGFPLTIYLLTSVFGVSVPWLHMNGHLWSALLGLGATGAMIEMVIGFGIIGLGLLMIAGGWRQIYRAQKEGRLVTEGLYRYVRHPQYTGIFLAVFGQAIHWPTLPTYVLAPFIVLLYIRLARREEADMVSRFGGEYPVYMARTGRFWPKRGQWQAFFKTAWAGG